MRNILPFCFSFLFAAASVAEISAQCQHAILCEICQAAQDSLIVSDPVALFDSLPQPKVNHKDLNLSFSPKVFSGYQKIIGVPEFSKKPLQYNIAVSTPIIEIEDIEFNDSIPAVEDDLIDLLQELKIEEQEEIRDPGMPSILKYKTPQWLKDAFRTSSMQESLLYAYMIDNPMEIEYAYWDLPLPPVLLEEDRSFIAFLNKQEVPEVSPIQENLQGLEVKKKHWLHTVGAQLQFSQAYVSPNWYQGGNNYLSLLFGFNWNVNLNQVYHPKLLFQSALQYKLVLNSNVKGSLHKYNISDDNFQYNLNAGLKASKDWYYSFNLQFKTQLLNNYEENSFTRTASFLSPGDLNLGLGMSYNRKNKFNTFQYTLTISPLSYNLKTCISDKVNHTLYNIPLNKKTKSEIGSNVDLNLEWKISTNISYKTRVFLFTDYKYFLGDWQNTFNFDINKFLSTQLFLHLRYDGSHESTTKWKKFMMREILSFGLSYTFSTKP